MPTHVMQRSAEDPQARHKSQLVCLHSAVLHHRDKAVQVPETESPYRNISLGYSSGPRATTPSQNLHQLPLREAA